MEAFQLVLRCSLSADKIDFMHSLDHGGHDVIWILEKERNSLKGYPAVAQEDGSAKPIYSYSVLSACAVYATRENVQDIMILFEDCSLSLWSGYEDLIPCSLPNNFQADLKSSMATMKRRRPSAEILLEGENSSFQSIYRSPSRQSRAINITELQANEIRLDLSDDTYARGRLDFIPQSQLVSSCLRVVKGVLQLHEYQAFRRRFLLFQFGPNDQYKTEWDNFITVFFSFFHLVPANHYSTGLKHDKSNSETSGERPEDDCWAYLLKDSQSEVGRLPFELERILDIRAVNSDANETSHMESVFESSKKLSLVHHKVPPLFNRTEALLGNLMLLFEELSLLLHSQVEAQQLGIFLYEFARSMNFGSYAEKLKQSLNDVAPETFTVKSTLILI
jgi:hypothetical protein